MVASDSSPVVSQCVIDINERVALKGSAWGAGKEERGETLFLLFSSFVSPVALPSVARANQIEKPGDESVVPFI